MNILKRILIVVVILGMMSGALVSTIPVARAVTLPNHLVINEFEQDAVGGVYNRQWLEIYNPTTAAVNIGNWKIVNVVGTTRTITADTIVPANGYYVFQFTGYVLLKVNERITLKNADGDVVDVTAKKSDTTDTGFTWQRYPNGVDDGTEGDWQFRAGTKWKSNGGETVSISISHSSVMLFDDVTLSGIVDPGRVADVQIQGSIDDGASWANITTMQSGSTGAYSYSVTPFDVGSYRFRARLLADSGATSSTVSLTVNKFPSEISVFPIKTIKERESAQIVGVISPTKSSATVTLNIGMPDGTYFTRTTTTDAAGHFNYTFVPDSDGIWNVTASWGGDGTTQGDTSPIVSWKVDPDDFVAMNLPILLVVPIIAILMILLGVGLTKQGKRKVIGTPVSLVPTVKRAPSRMPRTLFSTRPRVMSARACPKCSSSLIYSAQYRQWFCQHCRRYY